jgi:hypothetical protein
MNGGTTKPSLMKRPSELLVFGEFEKARVFEVHSAPGGPLGCDEVLTGHDVEPLPAVLHLYPVPPGPLEVETWSLGLHVYADSILKHRDLVREKVFDRGECGGCESGLVERGEQPPGVLFGSFDEDVEVEGGAGNAVENSSDTADNDVLNPVASKGREYAREPVEHLFSSGGPGWPRARGP